MQLHLQDRMIVCGESQPQCKNTGRLCWLTVDPPHNDRFLKIMMIKEPADTTSHIPPYFVHLVRHCHIYAVEMHCENCLTEIPLFDIIFTVDLCLSKARISVDEMMTVV